MAKSASPTRSARRAIRGVEKVEIPGHGKVELRLDNDGLMLIEEELEELLDRLNEKRERANAALPKGADPIEPYVSVWEALEEMLNRWPMRTLIPLTAAATAHAGISVEDVKRIPPSIYNDDALAEALMRAISIAFGQDPDEADDPPPMGGADRAARSTGRSSSGSGARRQS